MKKIEVFSCDVASVYTAPEQPYINYYAWLNTPEGKFLKENAEISVVKRVVNQECYYSKLVVLAK